MADANVIAKLLSLGIEVKHSPRQQKVKCPSCNNQRNDKRDKSLSVNIEQVCTGVITAVCPGVL